MAMNPLLPADPEPNEPPLPIRGDWIAAGLVAVGLVIRLISLGNGLWFDEIQTLVDYVRRPLGVIVTTYDNQNQHLLYSVLARISVVLFGDGPAALRLPAALLGTASLWALYRFGRRLVGERQALLATALLTVSYHHVWFSQNARGYTGLTLFTLVGTGALLTLLTKAPARWSTIWTYAIAMGLAAYTHVTSIFVSFAHLVIIVGLYARQRTRSGAGGGAEGLRGPVLGLLFSGLVAVALYAPVLPQLLHTLVGPNPYRASTEWESPVWALAETFRGLAAGIPGGWFALVAGVVVAIPGVVSLSRRSWAVPALLVLPVVFTAAAVLALRHNLWPRFFFFAAGFAVLLAVHGTFVLAGLASKAWGSRVATAAMAFGVLGFAVMLPRAWRPKQDFETAARFVDSNAAPNDAVVTIDLTTLPYARYYQRRWTDIDSRARLETIEKSHSRTWLLYTFPIRLRSVDPGVWHRLQTNYETAAVYPGTVGGGAVVVMVSRRAQPTT